MELEPIVRVRDIELAIRELDLSGRAVCAHASLKSFGYLEHGAATIVSPFLRKGCTLLVPTFSSAFEIWPDPPDDIPRNGIGAELRGRKASHDLIYSTGAQQIDQEMGALPAAVLAWPGRVRGNHPLDSFTAIGPHARSLVDAQRPDNVYAPLESLAAENGIVLLMGVGLERMTLLHFAERQAGRAMFIRWANDRAGQPRRVEVGGCSEGFGNLKRRLAPLARLARVGASEWIVFPAAEALQAATDLIRETPAITHCADSDCHRCNDAVAGGPTRSF